MVRIGVRVAAAALGLVLGGCSMTAPSYTPALENTDRLMRAGLAPAKVGAFSAETSARNDSLSVHGKTMTAAQGSYAAYLADAIKQELQLARLWNPAAGAEILGVLLKNDFGAGSGAIEARILVRQGGQLRFDKVKHASHRWDARFVDAVPRGQQEYSVLVRKLVTGLFDDPDFTAALGKR